MYYITFVQNYVPNLGENNLGRIWMGTSGVRKIDTFLQPWNHKTPLLIVVQFFMLLKEITEKVKVKLSFCYKSVILSLPKPNIESKNFFYKSC